MFFLGLFIFIQGIIRIIRKIRGKRRNFLNPKRYEILEYKSKYNDENLNLDDSNSELYIRNEKNEKSQKLKYITEITNTTIAMTEDALIKNIIYFLKVKGNAYGIYNQQNLYLNIKFINSNLIEINIENLYMNNKNFNLKIKEFLGQFYLYKNKLNVKEIKKGDISDLSSCLNTFGLSCLLLFKNSSLVKGTINKKINKLIDEPIKFVYDNIFKVIILIGEMEINGEKLYVNLKTSIFLQEEIL